MIKNEFEKYKFYMKKEYNNTETDENEWIQWFLEDIEYILKQR